VAPGRFATFCCRSYISVISWTDVASSGPLSSLQFPVKRGNRIASPAPFRRRSCPAVWTGLRVISAPRTSRTMAGSNHWSASSFESTRAGEPVGKSREGCVVEAGSELANGPKHVLSLVIRCHEECPVRSRPLSATRKCPDDHEVQRVV